MTTSAGATVALVAAAGVAGGLFVQAQVTASRIPLPGATVMPATLEMLATFTGGQGTINVNSWSPDGKAFAYVTFDRVK